MPPAAARAPTEPPASAKAAHPSAACTNDRGACLHRRPAPRENVPVRAFVRLPQSAAHPTVVSQSGFSFKRCKEPKEPLTARAFGAVFPITGCTRDNLARRLAQNRFEGRGHGFSAETLTALSKLLPGWGTCGHLKQLRVPARRKLPVRA